MSKIKITKTLTQSTHRMVRDSSSPTGWSRRKKVTDATRFLNSQYELVPCDAPISIDYYDREAREGVDFSGGDVETRIEVEPGTTVTLKLDENEIKVILSALISAKLFTHGMYGNAQTPEQRERSLYITEIARKIGVPRDAILRDIL